MQRFFYAIYCGKQCPIYGTYDAIETGEILSDMPLDSLAEDILAKTTGATKVIFGLILD